MKIKTPLAAIFIFIISIVMLIVICITNNVSNTKNIEDKTKKLSNKKTTLAPITQRPSRCYAIK